MSHRAKFAVSSEINTAHTLWAARAIFLMLDLLVHQATSSLQMVKKYIHYLLITYIYCQSF